METKNLSATLEFISEFGDDNEAMASISLNPNFRWAKIRVCDDMPNANNQRIPVEEFDNLIEELYPDGLSETALNYILLFESDLIFECLGITEDESEDE